MCPKLIELLSWNGPTVHVCCFMLARASTKTFVSRIHIRQPSPKNGEKNLPQPKKSLAVTRQLRYHCILKQNVPFIVFLNTAALPHRRPPSSWTFRFTRRARGHDKTDIFSLTRSHPSCRSFIEYMSGWSFDLGMKLFDCWDLRFESC